MSRILIKKQWPLLFVKRCTYKEEEAGNADLGERLTMIMMLKMGHI